ncbi:hypothetical protein CJD36_011565 [Flavipsychrobacter stenotrophus]|uniref:Uncharacterized protein n=1 Tax=Flavipsychrobacter stenotrophus TaxID=2077091 RepID=A0A2S7SUN7_9BACT|nr:hypothetical protein [Flavipsychrobacter stenotrophus]PQJ10603.1 hypothetical protein CJD36_011565 [Flavipsychrobacter stenotrophus]
MNPYHNPPAYIVGAENFQPCTNYSLTLVEASRFRHKMQPEHPNLNHKLAETLRKSAEKLRKTAETGGFTNRLKPLSGKSLIGNYPKKTAGNAKKPPMAEKHKITALNEQNGGKQIQGLSKKVAAKSGSM